jgi:hypothetical protein
MSLGWSNTHAATPRSDGRGDDWLIGLGVASFVIGVILAIIGANQEPQSIWDDEATNQAALFGWAIILGSLSFFPILLGTIIRAGKIAAGRR